MVRINFLGCFWVSERDHELKMVYIPVLKFSYLRVHELDYEIRMRGEEPIGGNTKDKRDQLKKLMDDNAVRLERFPIEYDEELKQVKLSFKWLEDKLREHGNRIAVSSMGKAEAISVHLRDRMLSMVLRPPRQYATELNVIRHVVERVLETVQAHHDKLSRRDVASALFDDEEEDDDDFENVTIDRQLAPELASDATGDSKDQVISAIEVLAGKLEGLVAGNPELQREIVRLLQRSMQGGEPVTAENNNVSSEQTAANEPEGQAGQQNERANEQQVPPSEQQNVQQSTPNLNNHQNDRREGENDIFSSTRVQINANENILPSRVSEIPRPLPRSGPNTSNSNNQFSGPNMFSHTQVRNE